MVNEGVSTTWDVDAAGVVPGGGVNRSTGVRWIEEDHMEFFSDVVFKCIFAEGGVNKGDNGDGDCKMWEILVEMNCNQGQG